MATILGIGGGDLNSYTNLSYHRLIVKMAQAEISQPTALFVPTASNDDPAQYEIFKKIYGHGLGCKTDQILLMDNPMSLKEIGEKIRKANIIFVGPGNSLMMMRRFRHLDVAPLLYKAYQRGTIMAGIGAGASCWFRFAHSDAMSFYRSKQKGNWKFIRVKCLGLVDRIMLSPYYQNPERQANFEEMVHKMGTTGIGLPEKAAIVVRNGHFRLFSQNTKEPAYKIYKLRGKSVSIPIDVVDYWRPIGRLLSKPQV